MNLRIKIYQWTGYVCKSLIEDEKDYILDNLDKWLTDYSEYMMDLNDEDEDYLEFRDYVGIKIGMWQYNIGLYREAYPLINPMFGYNYKWLKRQFRKLKRIFK